MISLEDLTLKAITLYHANLIDIHNAMHALGLRTNEQAEEFNKKHAMKVYEAFNRRRG